jgi:hypothetical protein
MIGTLPSSAAIKSFRQELSSNAVRKILKASEIVDERTWYFGNMKFRTLGQFVASEQCSPRASERMAWHRIAWHRMASRRVARNEFYHSKITRRANTKNSKLTSDHFSLNSRTYSRRSARFKSFSCL